MASATSAPRIPGFVSEWSVTLPSAYLEAYAAALPRFSLDLVGIVVSYVHRDSGCRTTVYGLKALQQIYGQRQLEAAVGGPVVEPPLPLEVRFLLQTDLTDIFGPEDCAFWPRAQKVYDVFRVFFKPANLALSKIQGLALSKMEFCAEDATDYDAHADKQASWILFPVGHVKYRAGLSRGGFGSPTVDDACFCIFTKSCCDRERYQSSTKFIALAGPERVLIGNLDAGDRDCGRMLKVFPLTAGTDLSACCEAPTMKIPCRSASTAS